MKKIAVMLFGTFIMVTGIAFSQENIKIGYVEMRKAVNECKTGQAARDSIEKSAKEMQARIDKEKKKLDSIRVDYEKKAPSLSDQERQDKQKEFQEKVQAFQQMVADDQKSLNDKEVVATKKIFSDIKKVIADLAKAGGYTLIIEKTDTSVLYSIEGLDLTGKVIEKMNTQK
jgi:outer membrane protein